MDPSMISSVAGAGVSTGINLISLLKNAIEKRKATKELDALQRPTYSRPGEIVDFGRIAAMMSLNTRLPGQDIAEANIGQSTANAVQAARELGGAADITSIVAQENRAKNELAVQAAANVQDNKSKYLDVLQILGGYSDQEFDYNVNLPYQEKRQDLKQKIQAGAEGVNNAIGNFASMGASLIGTDFSGAAKKSGEVDLSGLSEMIKNLNLDGLQPQTQSSGGGMWQFGQH